MLTSLIYACFFRIFKKIDIDEKLKKNKDQKSDEEQRLKEIEERYQNKDVDKPPHWGGYLVTPRSFEFWQGRNNRLHDRIIYEFIEQDTWERNRLAP